MTTPLIAMDAEVSSVNCDSSDEEIGMKRPKGPFRGKNKRLKAQGKEYKSRTGVIISARIVGDK